MSSLLLALFSVIKDFISGSDLMIFSFSISDLKFSVVVMHLVSYKSKKSRYVSSRLLFSGSMLHILHFVHLNKNLPSNILSVWIELSDPQFGQRKWDIHFLISCKIKCLGYLVKQCLRIFRIL